jgi:hypothetical protein
VRSTEFGIGAFRPFSNVRHSVLGANRTSRQSQNGANDPTEASSNAKEGGPLAPEGKFRPIRHGLSVWHDIPKHCWLNIKAADAKGSIVDHQKN